MIVVGIAACDSELFAVYAGPISVENACMAVGQLQLELRNSLADIFQVTMWSVSATIILAVR